MSPKNLALIAAAVGVMAMGVYLFIQVRSSPAQAQATSSTSSTHENNAPTQLAHPAATTNPPPVAHVTRPMPSEARPLPSAPTAPPALTTTQPDESQRANPKQDSMMELANKAYDTQDFDQAIAIAGKILAKDPSNVRMLRIMVSANCIGGDSTVAQQYYEKLPKQDRQQMKLRCDRYQVSLKDPP